uniref:hypothetical protein n=1 Tax=Pedobacter schmidteae TaxID=2201271 RepID=UPI000EB49DCC|nr:hypothetical protein [Pedobacter schmidteae]
MELDALKSVWNKVDAPTKTSEEIRQMLKENNHPVLKEIRKQLWIEIMGWSAFLLVYYTMFDGDQKPFFINVLLVISVLFALVHNLTGYELAKHLSFGTSVKASLLHYLSKVKTYARISIASRVLLVAGFLLFFTYNISFSPTKYISMALVLAAFMIQLIVLFRMWQNRLKKLKASITGLE